MHSIKCPYCFKNNHRLDYGECPEDQDIEITCDFCEKPFFYQWHRDVYFTSSALEE